MLDLALVCSVVALAVGTWLLMAYGRLPLGGWPERAAAVLVLALAAWIATVATHSNVPLAIVLGLCVLIVISPTRWYAFGAFFFASLTVATVVYGIYLARATLLLGDNPISLAVGLALLAIEYGAMALIVASAFEMVDAVCARYVLPPLPPAPARWPVVCLQIPTHNEPPELIIETIESLVGLDYPALRIQVIDNNTDDEALWKPVQACCENLAQAGHKVEFAHLANWPGFKAGALNWGRQHLDDDVEIIGVVDADYIVNSDWLKSTVPYFTNPKVAFVQTPQDYRAWENSAFYRACYVGFAYFFQVGMVSRARRNAIIFAGTMGLIRRSVLDEVGGWDERIITEDAEVSLRVLARGYRCVYLPKAYGKGIMPLTYEGLRSQRYRWAFGGIQILKTHWRTILGPRSGFTLGQRYDHLIGTMWWFNDALTLGFTLFVAAAAVGVILGRPFEVQRLTALGLVLPIVLLFMNLVRYLWALRVTTRASAVLALQALRVNLSLSWVIALACVRGLTQERGVFLRTPKFAGAATIREIRVVWVETLIAAVSAGLMVLVTLRTGVATLGFILAILLAWALFIYGSALTFALGDPNRAPLGAVLRKKMGLELAPAIGATVRSRPARLAAASSVLLVFVLVAGVVSESGRIGNRDLPFNQVPAGPLLGHPAPVALPSASPTPPITGGSAPSIPGLRTLPPGATPPPVATPPAVPTLPVPTLPQAPTPPPAAPPTTVPTVPLPTILPTALPAAPTTLPTATP